MEALDVLGDGFLGLVTLQPGQPELGQLLPLCGKFLAMEVEEGLADPVVGLQGQDAFSERFLVLMQLLEGFFRNRLFVVFGALDVRGRLSFVFCHSG